MCCDDNLHQDSFVDLFHGLKTASAPLQKLLLSCAPICGPSSDGLCRAIEEISFCRLEELQLRMCQIGNADMAKIANSMASSPHRIRQLRSLDLSSNLIDGRDGARALFSALQAGACPQLCHLNIFCCQAIGDEGLINFAEALEAGMPCSETLVKIDFQESNIGQAGVKRLFQAMATKIEILPNVKDLDLSSNPRIGDRGIYHMLEALSNGAGGKLKSLDLVYIRKGKITPACHDANAIIVIHRCIYLSCCYLPFCWEFCLIPMYVTALLRGEACFYVYIYI